MITIYDAKTDDFGNNGLGALTPTTCTVTETLNGEYELMLEHSYDDAGKWQRLIVGNIIKAPVPAAKTPRVEMQQQQSGQKKIYRVTTDGRRLYLRVNPDQNAKGIYAYKVGTEVIALDEDSQRDWIEVTTPDGKHGWMWKYNLDYVRTEGTSAAISDVVESRELREQPFRIYKVTKSLNSVTVNARHIFYDLMDNMIKECKIEKTDTGAAAVAKIKAAMHDTSAFNFYSDLDTTADENEIENTNPAEAILGSEGITTTYKGELARDWYDVYIMKRVGNESNILIREGKNLLGITYEIDDSNVITRIMPTGTDKDGERIYLPELYIDSENIDQYPNAKWTHLEVSEAKESTDKKAPMTKDEVLQKLRDTARQEFENGCDLPDLTLNVDFVNTASTEEYKQYGLIQEMYLGDTATVVAKSIGVGLKLRMLQYTYDCLMKRYTNVSLGNAEEDISSSMISASQIPSGVITGSKIAYKGISSSQLGNGSVGSLQIGMAAIDTAHIKQATVNELSANSVNAIKATIRELVAGHITTDQLYADLAEIATAQITTANIKNANIDWAQIQQLSAQIAVLVQADIKTAKIDIAQIDNLEANIAEIVTAKIGDAKITTAQIINLDAAVANIASAKIGTAKIDFAKVYDLTADTAIITEGVSGQLFISRLAVTDANMVSLTTGELMLKAADGSFVRLIADGHGGVTTQTVQVEGSNIANSTISGGKIIENSITARELNVTRIFADNALIRAIKAANIDVANLFAAEATIAALDAYVIRTNTIEALKGQLSVWADDKIELAVDNIHIGGVQLLKGTSETDKIGSRQSSGNGGASTVGSSTYGDAYPDKWERLTLLDTSKTWWRKYVTISGLVVGATYTFSAEVKNFGHEVRIGAGSAFTSWTIIEPYGQGKRISVTFEATTDSDQWLMIDCRHSSWSTLNYFDVRKLKLEAGNKATDWCENTTELSSRITQTAGAIELKADATTVTEMGKTVTKAQQDIDALEGKVSSKVSQKEFDALGRRVSTAESDITQTPDKISAAVKGIRIGGAQLIKGSDKTAKIGNLQNSAGASGTTAEELSGDDYPDTWQRITDTNSAHTWWRKYLNDQHLIVGEEYTFSAEIRNYGNEVRIGATTMSEWESPADGVPTRISQSFTATAETGQWLMIDCRRKSGGRNYFDVRKIKLEFGNKATDWTDIEAEFRAGSSIEMTREKVLISTPEFAVDLPGDNDLHMDKDGASMGNLNVTGYFDAPNIARTVQGQDIHVKKGNKYSTLSQVAAYLNNSIITSNVTIYLDEDAYGDFELAGIGGSGILGIYTLGHTLYGSLTLSNISCEIDMYGVKIALPSASAKANALDVKTCGYLYMRDDSWSSGGPYKSSITGKGATVADSTAIYLHNGTNAYIINTSLFNAESLIAVRYGCNVGFYGMSGKNCTNFLAGSRSVITWTGSRPVGAKNLAACITSPADLSTLSANDGSGTAPTPSQDTTTISLQPTKARTNYGTTSWQTAQERLYQGMYGSDAYRAVYWFDRTSFAGKTIKGCTLTIARMTGSGTGGAVNIRLWGTPLSSTDGNGNPRTNAVDYGVIGTLNSGETKILSVPLTAAQALAAGTIKGFMLDPADTAISSRGYSANYTKLDAAATLIITY